MIRFPASKPVLRKGDGIIFMHDGTPAWGRFPPPEALDYDRELGFDAPPFSHTGAHHHDDTDHATPGVGHQIDGQFEPAPHGGFVFKDGGGGAHFHGLDALIHGIGEYFSRRINMGIPNQPAPSQAIEAVQRGLDRYNETATDKLPDVQSPEWRRIGIGRYQGKGHDKKLTRKVRGADGNLATMTTNLHGDTHHLGTFLESSANYAHMDIAEAVAEMTGNNPTNVMNELDFLKYPYVYAQHHSFRTDPNTGKLIPSRLALGQRELGTGGTFTDKDKLQLTSNHFGKLEGISEMGQDRHENRLTSWGLHNELPDPYHMETSYNDWKKGVKTDSVWSSHRTAKSQILEALGIDDPHYQSHTGARAPVDISHLEGVNWADPETKTSYPIGYVLQEATQGRDELLDKMLLDFNKLPSFHKLFGRTQKTSAHTALDDYYATHENHQGRGHLSREEIARHGAGMRKDNPGFMDAAVQADVAAGGEAPKRWRTHNLHNNKHVIGNFATMHSSGVNPNAVEGGPTSNWGLTDIDDATLKGGLVKENGQAVRFNTATRANIPQRRAQMSALAKLVMSSREGLGDHVSLSDEEFSRLPRHHSGEMENIGLMGTSVPEYLQDRMVTEDVLGQAPAPERVQVKPPVAAPVAAPPPPVAPPPPAPKPAIPTVAPPPPAATPAAAELPAGQTSLTDFNIPQVQPPAEQQTPFFTPQQIANREALAAVPKENLVQVLSGMREAGHMPHIPRNLSARQARQIQSTLAPRRLPGGGQSIQSTLGSFSRPRPRVVKSEAQERIEKTLERIQILEAMNDDIVKKHLPNISLNVESEFDVGFMANKMDLTSTDVRAILHSKGDWERVAKTYSIPNETVKVVKVAFRGD